MTAKRDFITKSNGKFQVKSHSGKVLGTHATRAAALQQLRAVEYHKAHDAHASMGALELPGATEEEYLSAGVESQPCDGGGDTNIPLQPPLENLATERAEERAGVREGHPWPLGDSPGTHEGGALPAEDLLNVATAFEWPEQDDAPGRVAQQAMKLPFQPGGNGDPSPNPSAEQTIGSTASVSIAGGANQPQPDETTDEGDPNQYEMASTPRSLDPHEGNEPGYAETSPSSGPDDRKQGWRDPSGDDDFLRAIGAMPVNSQL